MDAERKKYFAGGRSWRNHIEKSPLTINNDMSWGVRMPFRAARMGPPSRMQPRQAEGQMQRTPRAREKRSNDNVQRASQK